MAPSRKKPLNNQNSEEQKSTNNLGRLQISVAVPALSGLDPDSTAKIIEEVKNNIFNSINDAELQRALDKWTKENRTEQVIVERDFMVLKSVITEYLDSYILFGYNPAGERVIVQHANTPKDRDAVMEFLKTIFIQQQQNNFLDDTDLDDTDDDEHF
jgi:hypothetical protein